MTYKLLDQLDKVLGKDQAFSGRAAISPLFLVATWQEDPHPLHVFAVTKGRDSTLALNEREYIAIATDKFREYFNGEISLRQLQEDYDIFDRDVDKLYEEVTDKDLSGLSGEELKQYFIDINVVFLGMARKTIYIENVDYEKILSVVGLENKIILDEIWERATEAAFLSFDGRRLKKMLDLVSTGSTNAVRKAKFIYTDYFWTKSESDISAELEKIKADYSAKEEEFAELKKIADQKKAEHHAWVETLSGNAKKIAEYAQLVMEMRDVRKDPIAKIQAMMAELAPFILEKAGVNPKAAPHVLLYEYMQGAPYLSGKKEEIENRENGAIYVAHPNITCEVELCNFDLAIKEITEIIEKRIEKPEDLKGQIACKGNVKGIVRVVFDPHDDKGFQDGDILVTSMTRPEFVPIMKRAGAVVTNEGGITCHAAIVSRELGIPCIIGTKIATQFLKDGMEVEVDANTGAVKILK